MSEDDGDDGVGCWAELWAAVMLLALATFIVVGAWTIFGWIPR